MLSGIRASAQQWQFASGYGGGVAGFSDAVNAMCTDAAGNVYVTGNFNNSINFGNGTATLTPTPGGTQTEGFVAKFSPAGLCLWAIDFGGAATDAGGLAIVTDGTTVYVTGQSQFPCMIGSSGPLASVGGSTDGIVFALNAATGSTLWARAFGGSVTTDKGQAICMDITGNIYISGSFATRTANPFASFGTAGAFQRTVQGNITSATTDLFVAQLNATTGNFNWVSTGGAISQETPSLVIGNDNVSGCGIAYLPVQNQLVITGSFANANAAYYSNGAATPAVTLTNAGQADICILKMDLSGNFLSGLAAGGANADEALSVSYNATTSAAYISGYFNSSGVSGAFSLTNTAAGFDEVFYARYNPATNTIDWAKNAGGSTGGNDVAFGNDAGASGIYITGRFQGTISFPGPVTPLTATTGGNDDVFLVKVNPVTGEAITLATASSNIGTDAGMDVAVSIDNNVWVGGIFGGGTLSFIPSSPAVAVSAGADNELFIARYNDPPPSIIMQPSLSTTCLGLSSTFTVTATTAPLTYQWQESTDALFSVPVTLTNTGIYSGATTATLSITDNSTLNGRYYRARVTNSVGTVFSNGALLTVTSPALPSVNTSQAQVVNTANNLYYGASCNIIAKVVPSGASPVTGMVTSEVWVESTVPVHGSAPFVQRHYQITPTNNPLTATGTVTLYFSQADFDAFNAAPGSTDKLPTGPSDNTGKANLRIGKYSGSSNNGTGLPDSYTAAKTVIDPSDANITWNAATGMWEITFDVDGFSGFVLQTSQFPLPVKLLSFTAKLSGDNVNINWKTSEEREHDHFELERSTDGRYFTPVASIEPATGNGNKSYDYADATASQLNASTIYYRLKMVSTSGSVEYSSIIVVTLTPASTPVTRVGPNPFQQKLEIGLNLPEASQLLVQLADIYGRIVVQENRQAPKGFSTYVWKNAQQLTRGVYILTVHIEGKSYSYKILKQ